MSTSKTLLCLAITGLLLAGCTKQEAAPTEAPTANEAAASTPDPQAAATPTPTDVAATPARTPFDISMLPVSDKPLGEWPYVALPAGGLRMGHG